MKKQIILTLGALTTITAPIITLISCGDKEDPNKQPFDFNGDKNKLPNTNSVHNIGNLYAKVEVDSGTYYSYVGPIFADNGKLSNQASLEKLASWLNKTNQKFNNYLVMESNKNVSLDFVNNAWRSEDNNRMPTDEYKEFNTSYKELEWSTTDFRNQ